jgi:hypothetical protein
MKDPAPLAGVIAVLGIAALAGIIGLTWTWRQASRIVNQAIDEITAAEAEEGIRELEAYLEQQR